jgi:hypothetical protein
MSETLKLTHDEIHDLVRKREEKGQSMANFPNSDEVQQIEDQRFIAAAKRAKQRGGAIDGGFDIDSIKPGMSAEDRAKARAAIARAWSNK